MQSTVFHPAVAGFVAHRAGGEVRARLSQADPRDPVVAKWFGSQNATEAGIYIDEDRALTVSTFYACVKVLSESTAILPLQLRTGTEDESDIAAGYPLQSLLRRRPNAWQTPIEFMQMMVGHVVLRGAGYSQIVRINGKIDQLIPLHPDRMQSFKAPDGTRCYAYQPPTGAKQILLQDEVFYIPGHTSGDGYTPLSVLAFAKETIGLAAATNQYGARYFKNNANPGGVLEIPGKMSDDAYQRLRSDWQARHEGGHNAHKVAILEEGLKFQNLGITAQDAQFVESRKVSPIEICQIFLMPPHKVQILAGSTNNNIEQQSLDFVMGTLMPLLVKIEQSANRDLLTTKAEQNTMFYKFDVDEMFRGDQTARTAYYNGGLQNGWLTRNQVRKKEGLKAAPDATLDQYNIQMNMGQGGADKLPKSQKTPPANNPDNADPDQKDETNE